MRYITKSVWFSSQNLTTDMPGQEKERSPVWQGRGWLHGQRSHIRLEWSHGSFANSGAAATVNLSGGDAGRELTFHVGLPRLFSWFLSFDYPWFEKWMPGTLVQSDHDGSWFRMPTERQIGLRFFSGSLWGSIWENPNEWHCSDPKWHSFHIDIRNLLLGKEKRLSSEITDEGTDKVVMPEGEYLAEYEVQVTIAKRPRWFARVIKRTTIDLPVPIPIPGKGENSWDCEDDAIHSVSTAADSIPDALQQVRESAMRDRLRYGGLEWRPEAKPKANPIKVMPLIDTDGIRC